MRIQIDQSLDDYINVGDATTHALLLQNGPLLRAIRQTYAFFQSVLWSDLKEMTPVTMATGMNAFMLYVAGVRMAMTGHASAIFPLLRTALESACYTFQMSQNSSLEKIWLDRHDDKQSHDASRKAFGSAIKNTAAGLDAIDSGSGDFIKRVYDEAIDFGGHPNVRSILPNISAEERDDAYHVQLGGLYGPEAVQVAQALVACLDFGQAIGLTLLRSLKHPSEEMAQVFNDLDFAKQCALVEIFNSQNGEPAATGATSSPAR